MCKNRKPIQGKSERKKHRTFRIFVLKQFKNSILRKIKIAGKMSVEFAKFGTGKQMTVSPSLGGEHDGGRERVGNLWPSLPPRPRPTLFELPLPRPPLPPLFFTPLRCRRPREEVVPRRAVASRCLGGTARAPPTAPSTALPTALARPPCCRGLGCTPSTGRTCA